MQILTYLVYTAAGLGAGVVTGLAGLSAAVVITPMLVSLCGWESYDAVTVALASDVLASMLLAYTYYNNKNIDLRRGGLVMVTAFLGTIAGSYCGFLFSRHSPDGLGYISMLMTVFLGVKFLVKPISGGGILMLTVFTLVLGYNLKVAVGTSTMIMTLVALTGAVSHISLGARIFPLPMAVVVLSCLLGAVVSAKFANRCEIARLNRIVGIVLALLGIVTIAVKLL